MDCLILKRIGLESCERREFEVYCARKLNSKWMAYYDWEETYFEELSERTINFTKNTLETVRYHWQ